jgi:hypothetical protein
MTAETNVPTGHDPDNPDVTMAQLEELIAAWEAARDGLDEDDEHFALDEWAGHAERFRAAVQAILDVRPTDPLVLVAQLRWLVGYYDNAPYRDLLTHVADHLEAMAAQQKPGAGPLSSTF